MLTIAMMYLRVFIFLMIFSPEIVGFTLPYFLGLFVISAVVGVLFYQADRKKLQVTTNEISLKKDENPLEFKVAIIFAGLYVLFSIITNQVLLHYGESGLSVLSVIVGVTDITPFLLNLFQGSYEVGATIIAIATFQAMVSNNILKTTYSQILAGTNTRKAVLKAFAIVILANVVVVGILYMM